MPLQLTGFDQPLNPQQFQQQLPMMPMQAQGGGGFGGMLSGVARSIASPFAYLINTDIINPTKEIAAQVTGNKTALKNARKESNTEMGLGAQGKDVLGGLKKWGGNSAQALSYFVPGGAALKGKVASGAAMGAIYGGGDALAKNGSLDDTISGILTGGATGGAFGAAAHGIGKIGTGVGKAVSKTGAKLEDAGTGLIAKEFRLNPTQQFNFKNLHGEEATSVLKRYGVRSVEDLGSKIQPLQQQFDAIITQVPAISQKELSMGLKKVYQPLLDSPAMFEKGLGQQLKDQANLLIKQAANGKISAEEVNSLRQVFDQAVHYTQKGAPEYNVIKKTADALRQTLQNAADNSSVRSIDGKTFKEVGLELSKLRGLQDIVGKQEYLGTGSLPMNLTNMLGGTMAAGATGGPLGALSGMAMSAGVNSPTGRRVLTESALGLGGKLSSIGARLPQGGGLSDAVTNALTKGATAGAIGLQSPNIAASTNAASTSSAPIINADMPSILGSSSPMAASSLNTGSQYSNTGDLSSGTASLFDPANLENAVLGILQNGGNVKDVTDYISMVKAVNDIKMAAIKAGQPKEKSLSATQVQQSNNAMSALEDLQGIRQTLQQKPNTAALNSLPGGGLTRRLTGTSGYEAARQNVADALGRLRSGGAINKDEEKRFLALLPGAFDDAKTAEAKLGRLETLFQSFAYPKAATGSLEDALMSIQ